MTRTKVLCYDEMRYHNDGESFHGQDERLSRFELRFDPTLYLLSPTIETHRS